MFQAFMYLLLEQDGGEMNAMPVFLESIISPEAVFGAHFWFAQR